MDLYGKLTLGQLTEQLQEYVKKFGNGLGIDDKEDKGARGRKEEYNSVYRLSKQYSHEAILSMVERKCSFAS